MSKKVASTRVLQKVRKISDLEMHVRVMTIEGVKVIEFRDYNTSLKTYGRGYWIPLNEKDIFSTVNALTEIVRSELD